MTTKYTTIRIKESSRKKLEQLREGTDQTFSDIIENLLEIIGGVKQPVEEIKRKHIAIPLLYTNFHERMQKYNITFHELKQSQPGDMFYANSEPADEYYMNTTAEVLFVDDVSCAVRVVEIVITEEGCSQESYLNHIDFF